MLIRLVFGGFLSESFVTAKCVRMWSVYEEASSFGVCVCSSFQCDPDIFSGYMLCLVRVLGLKSHGI